MSIPREVTRTGSGIVLGAVIVVVVSLVNQRTTKGGTAS